MIRPIVRRVPIPARRPVVIRFSGVRHEETVPAPRSGVVDCFRIPMIVTLSIPLCVEQNAPPAKAVTVVDNGNSWALDNGIVKATITKDNGSMPSFIYHGMQMLA